MNDSQVTLNMMEVQGVVAKMMISMDSHQSEREDWRVGDAQSMLVGSQSHVMGVEEEVVAKMMISNDSQEIREEEEGTIATVDMEMKDALGDVTMELQDVLMGS